jgi:hypothetical protein
MVEEAGELAGKIMALVRMGVTPPEALPGGEPLTWTARYFVTEATLETAAACGEVMGLMKKVYRNEPQGELTPERVSGIVAACERAQRLLAILATQVQGSLTVEFPPVTIHPENRLGLTYEAGDILWYLAAFCTEAKLELGQVAYVNIAKLLDRKSRGVVAGTGDDR